AVRRHRVAVVEAAGAGEGAGAGGRAAGHGRVLDGGVAVDLGLAGGAARRGGGEPGLAAVGLVAVAVTEAALAARVAAQAGCAIGAAGVLHRRRAVDAVGAGGAAGGRLHQVGLAAVRRIAVQSPSPGGQPARSGIGVARSGPGGAAMSGAGASARSMQICPPGGRSCDAQPEASSSTVWRPGASWSETDSPAWKVRRSSGTAPSGARSPSQATAAP